MRSAMTSLSVDDFDFHLPPELIAQHPAAERRGSRLLHVCPRGLPAGCCGEPENPAKIGSTGLQLVDRQFADLPGLLRARDLLVFNDTRVIKARFFGCKDTGGHIEVMLERIVDATHAICQIRASKAPKAGSTLRLADAFDVRMTGRAGTDGDFFALELVDAGNFWELSEQYGKLPLPPYIEHPAEGTDETRYQTVYAREPGAVAAPTAGLHFDEAMLETLRAQGINTAFLTLHVGAGTYRPMRVEKIADHRMHSERFEIPQATVEAIAATRAAGGRIIAVGTTSLRALESAGNDNGAVRVGGAETDIFITPGYRFKVVDRLITNFHLPKSTLLMLVSAFSGMAAIREAYAHAVAQRYRFFSYGDAMLLEKADAV